MHFLSNVLTDLYLLLIAIALEEQKVRLRADDARHLKQQVEEDKKMTLDDLTRGVINYKNLGLDFERTEAEGRLR